MRTHNMWLKTAAALLPALAVFSDCSSTDGDGGSGSVYYGTGFDDAWYYGSYPEDVDIVVTPPPPRPTHPIATLPPVGPRPTPMPSIPARPMPRGR
jgi:hypothetical protein